MTAGLIIYAGLIAALTFAQLRENRRGEYILKPLAAFGFILIALLGGALYWHTGRLLLLGLGLCAIGDVCLLSRDKTVAFKLGMATFATGHLFYAAAFLSGPYSASVGTIALIVMFGVSALVYQRLRGGLPDDMKVPIWIYMAVISLMVAAAFSSQNPRYIMGAVLFAISDIAVARDKFIAPSPKNALMITPLYFAAQALFALSAAIK